MLAQQESAHDELRAGANETFDVRAVLFIHRHRNLRFHCFYPFKFEIFPPLRELAEPANVIQHHLKFLVICRRELCNQDPRKEVQAGQTEVVEVVPLHAAPTKSYRK